MKGEKMTRDEALEILDHNWTRLVNPDYTDEELGKAQDMAIEALEQCEMAYEHGWTDAESEYRKILERKRGEWIQIEDVDANGNAWYECPFCHKSDCHAVSQIVSYCWNCGADMRGDEDDEVNTTAV